MPTDVGGVERCQAMMRSGGIHPHQPEPENLPCPRCDSTNTKFCYYNNYNLSQPRYFCKGCRRYWTRGGTLRNIPVGGGTRKNSKRSRSSSSTAAATIPPPDTLIKSAFPSQENCDLNLNPNPNPNNPNECSFTSLLTANPAALQGGGFMGYDVGQAGFEEMGLGFGYAYGYGQSAVGDNSATAGNGEHNWQLTGSDGGNVGGGTMYVMDGGEYFGWPDLTISTAGQGSD